MQYEVIGSIGYAQLGSEDYLYKRKVEKTVLMRFLESEIFNIPEAFKGICQLGIKRFPYEYDSYEQVVLYFNSEVLDEWELELEDDESDDTRFYDFWEFFRTLESVDFETPELIEQCHKEFTVQYPLFISHKRKGNDENDNLKAV